MVLDGFALENPATRRVAGASLCRRRGSPAGRAVMACVVVGLTIVSVGLVLTSRAAATVESGYRIGMLKKQLEALKNENALLEAELASIQSPSRVEEIARERLDMVPPEEIRVARLDRGWQAAMAAASEEAEGETENLAASLFDVLTRIASGSRTAQAGPAR